MKFEDKYNPLFSFTQISDIFFTDYLPELDPVSAKLYITCLYLNKRNKEITRECLADSIKVTPAVIDEKLISLENAGLLVRMQDRIILQDINQKELDRLYRSRTVGAMSDEFTLGRSVINKRTDVVKSISDKFFVGQMAPSWYTEIDLWFDKYGFEPEVMFMLFQHCSQNRVITKPYIRKVAESWGEREIRTAEQLEKYLTEYDRFKEDKGKVAKKLRLNGNMDAYSEDILRKWFLIYKYDFDTVEIALKSAPRAQKVTLSYFDSIITQWYKLGLREKDQVEKYEAERREKVKASSASGQTGGKTAKTAAQKANYQGRTYDEDFLKGLYKDIEGEH